jgi:hypothetical protein
LLDKYPHVLAYVAGHTHQNRVTAFPRSGNGGVWWGIETSATADWPVQHRLIEVMDNKDGTLSIFGTLLDHAAAAAAPPSGPAMAFDEAQLASIGRELAYNDPEQGAGTGECTDPAKPNLCKTDQNVELLVRDPRGFPRPAAAANLRVPFSISYKNCANPNRVHPPPLSAPSCNPAQQASQFVTVGTTDANGNFPSFIGSARLRVTCNPPAPNPSPPCTDAGDQADVAVTVSTTDIRDRPSLADYAGGLQLATQMQITDKHNGATPADDGTSATVVPLPLTVPVPCTPTPDTTVGSSCGTTTTLDSLVPGTVPENARSNWELGDLQLLDGGLSGQPGATDATLFAHQGIFIP